MVGLGLSPKYVLDEMQFYEIDTLLDGYYLKHKDSWEQARMISYIIAQINSKETLNPEDIMKFYWEKDNTTFEINHDEIELQIKELEDKLNNK